MSYYLRFTDDENPDWSLKCILNEDNRVSIVAGNLSRVSDFGKCTLSKEDAIILRKELSRLIRTMNDNNL